MSQEQATCLRVYTDEIRYAVWTGDITEEQAHLRLYAKCRELNIDPIQALFEVA